MIALFVEIMKWLFNPIMLWSALFGMMIVDSAFSLREVARHKGGGVVHYGDDSSEFVSEAQFKRHHYAMDGMMLVLGIAGWCWIAHIARDPDSKCREGNSQ